METCQSCTFIFFFAQKNLSRKLDNWQFIWSGFRADCLSTGGSSVLGANHSKLSAALLGHAAHLSVFYFFLTLGGIFYFNCQRPALLRIVRDVHPAVKGKDKGDSEAYLARLLMWPLTLNWYPIRVALICRLKRVAGNVCCPTRSCVIAPEGCAFFNTCCLWFSHTTRCQNILCEHHSHDASI